jgi:Anti-sigma-K factor rskA
MTRTTHTTQECSWAEQTVLLALHALEPEQEAVVSDHLHWCASCPVTLREAEETFAAVGATAAEPPPPELRHKILAVVHQDAPPVKPVPIASRRAAREGRRPPVPAGSRRGPRRWAVAAVAAALVAGMAGGGFVVSQLDSQREAATVHADTLDNLLATITASPHAVLVDRQRRPVAAVVLGDEPRFFDLALSPPPAGSEWVLWGAKGQAMTALAPVPTGYGGDTTATPVGRPGEYEAYLVSLEAAGSLPARPSEVRASGPVVAARDS